MIKNIFFLLILSFLSNTTFSQEEEAKDLPLTRILFVLDGSQSMLGRWETGTKMNVAQELLTEMVDSLKDLEHIEMALRVYGHQKPVPPQDCSDTKLEVEFSKNNAKKIISELQSIRPKGTTPIAHSLELSANDFPDCDDCRNIIILITDGIESCNGDPCAVSRQLQKKGIILKPFVIGIGISEDFQDSFECIGRFYNASNENRFKEVLEVVISQALNTTTLQININNQWGKPTESNVNMTFSDNFTHEILHNFIHTINSKGNPDTLRFDPIPTYDIQVHTLPPAFKDSIVLTPGIHNTIIIDAPQGSLVVNTNNSPQYNDLKFIVRESGKQQTLNLQSVNFDEKYLTGNYDIEILTIPRMIIENIEIEQSKTFTIQIPTPGLVTFTSAAPGYGAVYKEEGNKLVWIYGLNKKLMYQTIVMQPGSYRVISRPKNAKESVFTSNIKFTVVSGGAQKIVLY
ncbi:MAG: VWA domain-containing protein [Salinivirgaceae bacterium]|nr:VWA domain-containing protein [Salinivirgaceae bacterium]